MFQNKPAPKQSDQFERFTKIALEETYYMGCIKQCITDYSTAINGQEKICLAKCLDRAYDYLRVVEKSVNPMNAQLQSKYLLRVDGANVLGMRKSDAGLF